MLVDHLFNQHRDLLLFLEGQSEISFASLLQDTTPKIVLLAGASYLEVEVQRVVIEFYDEITSSHAEAISFVRNKAIKRQYHTYFDWDGGKANSFFGLFGEDCLIRYKLRMRTDEELVSAVRSFCLLGSLRNQLVHGNYAAFVLDKTAEEVYEIYQSAARFVELLPELIRPPANEGA